MSHDNINPNPVWQGKKRVIYSKFQFFQLTGLLHRNMHLDRSLAMNRIEAGKRAAEESI